jgi:vancomycin permeability regulator SanA
MNKKKILIIVLTITVILSAIAGLYLYDAYMAVQSEREIWNDPNSEWGGITGE